MILLYFLGDTGLSNMSRHLAAGNTWKKFCALGCRVKA